MKFKIIRTNHSLKIEQNVSSIFVNYLNSIFGFFFSFIVFLFPYDQLVEINKYAYLVYLLPVIPLIGILKRIPQIGTGHSYVFDQKKNGLYYNEKKLDKLTNLLQVEWNIDAVTDHEESYLDLRTKNGETYRISTTSNFMNKEHLELGRTIAKFLFVEFINNNPLEKEVLWGKFNVDEKSINQIENKY